MLINFSYWEKCFLALFEELNEKDKKTYFMASFPASCQKS